MRIRMILCALCGLAFGLGGASADIIHRISYDQGPLVHVWSDGQDMQVGQSVTVGQTGVIPGEAPFYTGILEPVAFTQAKGGEALTIASNAPFSVRAELVSPALNLAAPVTLQLTDVGPNARAVANQRRIDGLTLGDLIGGAVVFQSDIRTAKAAGAPLTQAVTLTTNASGADILFTVVAEAPSRSAHWR